MILVVPLPRRVRAGLIAGPVALLCFLAAQRAPEFTEEVYARGLYPLLVRPLSWLLALLPFSLAEIVFAAIPLLLIGSAGAGFWLARAGRRGLWRALGHALVRLLGEAGWIWALFLLLWGLNYARARPPALFGLDEAPPPERAASLIEEIGRRLDETRRASPEDEQGVVRFGAFRDVDRRVRELQLEALEAEHLPKLAAPRSKRFAASRLLLRWGVSGIYGPFTGEPNVVDPAPPGRLPFVIAHERAHLAGFAWEEAASFVALLTLWRAPEPELRYAGWLALWMELRRGPKGRDPGVRRDMAAMVRFFKEHTGREAPYMRRVYSAYLRAHGVKGGTRSYGRVAGLALGYLETRGMPEPSRAGSSP